MKMKIWKKIVLLPLALLLLVGFVIAIVYPDSIKAAARGALEVVITNWPENQNVNITNTTPVPVSLGSSQPETKVITLWENHLIQSPSYADYYTDWVDVDGYKTASILMRKEGSGNMNFSPEYSIDGIHKYIDDAGGSCVNNELVYECHTFQTNIKAPKMRLMVNFWENSAQNVWIDLYLSK